MKIEKIHSVSFRGQVETCNRHKFARKCIIDLLCLLTHDVH